MSLDIYFLNYWMQANTSPPFTLASVAALGSDYYPSTYLSAYTNTSDDLIGHNGWHDPSSNPSYVSGDGSPNEFCFLSKNGLPNEYSIRFTARLGYRSISSGAPFEANGSVGVNLYGLYRFNVFVLKNSQDSYSLVASTGSPIQSVASYPITMTDADFDSDETIIVNITVSTFNDGFRFAVDFFNNKDWSSGIVTDNTVANIGINKTQNTLTSYISGPPINSNSVGNGIENGLTVSTVGHESISLFRNVVLQRNNTSVMVAPPTSGSSGSSGSSGYYKTVITDVFIPPITPSVMAGIQLTNGSYKFTAGQLYGYWTQQAQQVWVPGVPSVPSTLSVPATYTIGNGWYGSGRSIEYINGNGGYTFSVPVWVQGVVTGLNDVDMGSGYSDIDYAFLFQNGMYRLMSNGIPITSALPYIGTDAFAVIRVGSSIQFFKNYVKVFELSNAKMGALFADASLYASGDEVRNAEMLNTSEFLTYVGSTPITSSSSLIAATSSASDYNYSYSSASIAPIESTSIANSVLESTVRLSLMNSMSSDYNYGFVASSLSPAISISDGGFEAPSYSYSGGYIQPATSSSSVSTLIVMDSSSSTVQMKSVSSDYAYNYSDAQLLPAVSSDVIFLKSFGSATFNRPTINAWGISAPSTYKVISSGRSPTVMAYGSGSAKISMPSTRFTASGQSGSIGTAKIKISPFVRAFGTTEAMGGARLRIGINRSAKGFGAGLSSISISKPSVSSTGITGSVGSARISISQPIVNAIGQTSNGGVAKISVSKPYIVAPLSGRITISNPIFKSSGTTLIDWDIVNGAPIRATRYAAYAINLRHRSGGDPEQGYLGEVSTYENYQYNSIVRFGSKYYGSTENGLYLLEGPTDDGVPIDYSMKTATTDLGAIQFKTPKNMYIGGRINGGFSYQVIAGEEDPVEHSMPTVVTNKPWSSRVPFASGLRSRYYGFGVSNSGSSAEIESLNLEVHIHERA